MAPDRPLDGLVSIITGARGVIGKGIATELATAGSDVVVQTARDPNGSAEVPDEDHEREFIESLEALDVQVLEVNCDVRDPAHVTRMIDLTVDEFDRLDHLINNAGVVSVVPVEQMSEDEWHRVLDINLTGVFLCSRAAIPYLRETQGTIINNASIASFGGAAGLAHYCASKHGLIGLTKALALELASDDVTVNAICPGIVDTPMWSEVLTPEPDDYEAAIKQKIPLGRDQTPEDMGRLAVFLATSDNGGITSSAT